MKIIDCFLFEDEFNLLELRLEELKDTIDYFIIIESNKNLVGKLKPYNYDLNSKNYEKYHQKIINILIEDLTEGENPVIKRNYQISQIIKGIEKLNLTYDDIIFISNCNQIINPLIINTIRNNKINNLLSLSMDNYYYNFNCIAESKESDVKVVNYGYYINNLKYFNDISFIKTGMITNHGWWSLHYFNTVEKIHEKLNSYGWDKISKEEIRNKIKAGIDIRGLSKLSIINLDLDTIPKKWGLLKNLESTNIDSKLLVFTPKMNHLLNTYMKLLDEYKKNHLPPNHKKFLIKLKNEYNFEPKVCFDIGACVLHWTREVENIWPNTEVIVFDANEYVEMFYKFNKYHIGLLSDTDDKNIKFFVRIFLFF